MEAGGEHDRAGGGYTVGNGQHSKKGENGLGGTLNNASINYCCAGGGYYTNDGTSYVNLKPFFNQGGCGVNSTSVKENSAIGVSATWAGSGGASGVGGNVYYYDLGKIHAYNGDRITNGDYDTVYKEYNPDGTISDTVANVVIKRDGTKIVPAKIFAQSGIIRATYRVNMSMTKEETEKYSVAYIEETYIQENIKVTEETTTPITQYGQGIGSGAGNLEKSNGNLKHISEYEK